MSQVQPPMIGQWNVLVHAVRPYTIHSDLYYELQVSRLDEDGTKGYALRIPEHAAARMPNPGDRLTLTFLMGQVTSAKRIG